MGYVGYSSGSVGVATVDGTGSTWAARSIFVGNDGTGTLNITGGGTVTSASGGFVEIGRGSGAVGVVNVDGKGSTLSSSEATIFVGASGSGTLNITRGGTVNSDGSDTVIGNNLGSTGVVNVDGAGSMWTGVDSVLYVGLAGNGSGTLNITGGGRVSDMVGQISSGSVVTVDGVGSVWNNARLDINSGTLNIGGGGAVSNVVYIGYNSLSASTVTLDGAGSTWTNSGDLYVGYGGTGTVTQTGGTNSVAGTLYLGYNTGNTCTYNLNGGVLALSALSGGSGTAAFNFGGGTLKAGAAFSTSLPMTLSGIGGNANVDTAGYAVTLSGRLSGPGGLNKLGSSTLMLSGNNTYDGPTTVSAGTLQINNASSSMNVFANTGGVDVTGGYLVLDYSASGTSVKNTVQSLLKTAYNNGTNSFQTGQIRDTLATSTPGLGLGWVDNATTKQVTVMPALYGDANLDGQVTAADLGRLLANYNGTGTYTWSQGDFNYDGQVTAADLGKLLANFNQTGPLNISLAAAVTVDSTELAMLAAHGITVSSANPVPEPSTLVLFAIGAISLFAYGWPRRAKQAENCAALV
jgi:T5SS/PEP-CTERM-associated repeat protein/autotransporter-associated beta strand protein